MPKTDLATAPLVADATNRALRTALQQAVIFGLVAAGAVAVGALQDGDWPDLQLLLGTALSGVLAPLVSYVHRRWGDRTDLPTAVPPTDPIVPAGAKRGRRRAPAK